MNSLVLAQWIYSGRRSYGMTLKELADHAGVSEATISDWELGKVRPRDEEVRSMSEIFGPPPVAAGIKECIRDTGPDSATHAPFFNLLKQEREREAPIQDKDLRRLAQLADELVEIFRSQLNEAGFWSNPALQSRLRRTLSRFLDETSTIDLDRADHVADRLMELAKANHDLLVEE